MYSVPTIRGVHPSEAMMHFPLFQISPYFQNFFDIQWKILSILPFPGKNFRFSSAKISDFFYYKLPYCPCFTAFPPISQKILFPPKCTLKLFPPVFFKFTCVYILYMYFVSPYFDHDAFMNHTIHILNAPADYRRWYW